jgi:lipoyl(octanoyl) transferase
MGQGRPLSAPRIRIFRESDYEESVGQMQEWLDQAEPNTPEEIWLIEHKPVFTLGLAADPIHVIAPGDIRVVQANRGGEVTYHGPGQLVVYPLVNLASHGLMVREWVRLLEDSILSWVLGLGVRGACRWPGEPGVYFPVDQRLAKFAALGLKIRRGFSSHGLAINVQMNLEPFGRIHPCGHADLESIDLARMGVTLDWQSAAESFSKHLIEILETTRP